MRLSFISFLSLSTINEVIIWPLENLIILDIILTLNALECTSVKRMIFDSFLRPILLFITAKEKEKYIGKNRNNHTYNSETLMKSVLLYRT